MQTIVHVTDLHHSRAGSLKGDVSRAFIQNAVVKLNELRQDKSLGINPILVITGDIVQSGASEPTGSDFDCLQTDVLTPIMEAMDIDSSQVVLCPGNHELDRFAVNEEDKVRDYLKSSSNSIKVDLQKKLSGFFGFVEKHGYRSVTRDSPRIATFEFGKTNVTVLNALAGIYSDGGDLGEAFLTPSELQAGLDVIPNFSVVCMHHPVEWLNIGIRQSFTSLLGRKRCRLLTGHEHKPCAQFIQEGKSRMVMVRGGAAGETGEVSHFSVINLSPDSEAVNLRKFSSTLESGGFEGPNVEDSECHPYESRQFFMKTRAFLTTTRIQDIARRVASEQGHYKEKLLKNVHGNYTEPPIAVYDDNELNSKHCPTSRILEEDGVAVIGGDELSGKTTLTVNSVFNMNMSGDTECIFLFLDFRALNTESIEAVAVKKLKAAGCTNDEAKMLIRNNAVKMVIDNYSLSKHRAKSLFNRFKQSYPTTPVILVTAGGGQFNPSNAPNFLPEDTVYFRIKDINRETALKMASGMPDTIGLDGLKLASRVFKSLSSLGAPRNVFYVQHLIRMYVHDAAVEPLNQFLMQQKIITDSMNSAHKHNWPGVAYDSHTFEMFIGEIAYYFYDNDISFLSHGELYTRIEEFRARKGRVKKAFPDEIVFNILKSSNLLREYEDGIGFMVTGLEDYFLAKHMTHSTEFRDFVLSEEGLLRLPSVAQLYIAQNPSDLERIEIIFSHIDKLVEELKAFDNPETEILRVAIEKARPRSLNILKNEVQSQLTKLNEGNKVEEEIVLAPIENTVELGKRVKYSPEERAAIYIQLGASVIGVTRTLDADDRKALFHRLKPLLVIAMKSAAMLSQHLADGNSIRLRGTTIKANYVGQLKDEENRFYLILTGMLSNLSNSFGTWSGSLTFYASAEELLKSETDPLICAALLSQQIEADCDEAFQHLDSIPDKLVYPALMDNAVNNYLNGIRMTPPEEKAAEKSALQKLANVVSIMEPPKDNKIGMKFKQKSTAKEANNDDEARERNARLAQIYQNLERKIHLSSGMGNRILQSDSSKGT